MTSAGIALATSTATTLAGVEIKYCFGFILLGIAATLALTQAWVSTHPQPSSVAQAKATIQKSAEDTLTAASHLRTAAELVFIARTRTQTAANSADSTAPELADAESATDAANEKLREANKAIVHAQTSLMNIADKVATKLPLVGGSIIFALLGCLVSDLISFYIG